MDEEAKHKKKTNKTNKKRRESNSTSLIFTIIFHS